MIIVGGLGFTPETFYNMTLKETQLVIDGDRRHQEQYLYNMSYAVINGIGARFDKKFKFINPFDDNKKSKKNKAHKESNRDQLLRDMNDIKKQFNR